MKKHVTIIQRLMCNVFRSFNVNLAHSYLSRETFHHTSISGRWGYLWCNQHIDPITHNNLSCSIEMLTGGTKGLPSTSCIRISQYRPTGATYGWLLGFG